MKKIVSSIIIALLLLAGCGSYYYAELYIIHCNEKSFVSKVDSLKTIHPEYKYFFRDADGTLKEFDRPYAPFNEDTTLLHYNFAFFIPSENKVFQCYIVPYDSLNNKTDFILRFASVADTNHIKTDFINTKDINERDNSKYKRIFEDSILGKLNIKWEREQKKF